MGLDNIPKTYACLEAGTAIKNDKGQILCEETINAGHCPYMNVKNSDHLIAGIKGVTGMLGTPCWYRGKYGNYLLDIIIDHGYKPPFTFYGPSSDDDDNMIYPDECLELSEWMKDHIEAFAKAADGRSDNMGLTTNDLINDWIYAAWWLWFVATYCDGAETWY